MLKKLMIILLITIILFIPSVACTTPIIINKKISDGTVSCLDGFQWIDSWKFCIGIVYEVEYLQQGWTVYGVAFKAKNLFYIDDFNFKPLVKRLTNEEHLALYLDQNFQISDKFLIKISPFNY